VSDFLAEKRKEIQARLKELKPLHEEYLKLEAAEQALAGVGSGAATSSNGNGASAGSTSRSPRRSSTRKSSGSAGTGRRGRPKGSGNRGNQALELVRAKPGITIPELAEAMGIKQNYLYRVMPGLAEQGLVTKSGRGWHVKK
jgi:hypothetical protein